MSCRIESNASSNGQKLNSVETVERALMNEMFWQFFVFLGSYDCLILSNKVLSENTTVRSTVSGEPGDHCVRKGTGGLLLCDA